MSRGSLARGSRSGNRHLNGGATPDQTARLAARGEDARLRVIPRLSPATMPLLAWHVVPVTLLSFRTGWLY
jgi:hypothetical protein